MSLLRRSFRPIIQWDLSDHSRPISHASVAWKQLFCVCVCLEWHVRGRYRLYSLVRTLHFKQSVLNSAATRKDTVWHLSSEKVTSAPEASLLYDQNVEIDNRILVDSITSNNPFENLKVIYYQSTIPNRSKVYVQVFRLDSIMAASLASPATRRQ